MVEDGASSAFWMASVEEQQDADNSQHPQSCSSAHLISSHPLLPRCTPALPPHPLLHLPHFVFSREHLPQHTSVPFELKVVTVFQVQSSLAKTGPAWIEKNI